MNTDINDFHHIGLIGSDMDRIIGQYERLGFTFSPLSIPRIVLTPGAAPEPLGAGNRCAIFQNNYLEVLAVVDKGRWDKVTKEQRGAFDVDVPLARYAGLHVMHFATDDLEAVRERYLRSGIRVSDVKAFQRDVETPEGPKMMQAKTMGFPQGANPEGLIQVAQHLTPELVLQPRYRKHRNGVTGITETIVCASAADALAAKYQHYSGHSVQKRSRFDLIDLGQARIIVTTPDNLEGVMPGVTAPAVPSIAGFTVATRNLNTARQALDAGGVPFDEFEGRLLVSPKHACGSAVLFEQEAAKR